MARSGLTELIETLRGMTDAGTSDFTVGTTTYWSDNTLQAELDRHRTDIFRDELNPTTTYSAGTVQYKYYYSNYGNYEQTTGGTSIFWLENAAGVTLGTALYTVDYLRGEVIFVSDTTGSAVYACGRTYDLNGAAGKIWRFKAANSAKAYDFSTDNHKLSRSQMMQQYLAMATYYESQASPTVIDLYREDL